MTTTAVVLGASIAGPLLLLVDGTTVTVPALLPTSAAVVLVLTALTLLGRLVGLPIVRATRYVHDRLEENGALVEQVRELVQYVGLLGGDVEARLDRIEKALGLGYYRRDTDKPAPTPVPPSLAERLKTQEAIRDLGADPPTPSSWS